MPCGGTDPVWGREPSGRRFLTALPGKTADMRRTALLLLAALALLISGCSGDDGDEQRELAALAPVARDVTTQPDRDQTETERKLAALDPCLLFDAAVARKVGDPMDSRRYDSTHACRIGTSSTTTVKLAVALSDGARFYQGRHDAAGAVSYRTTSTKKYCTVSLPVTQSLAVEFNSWERRCTDTVAYAEAGARLLRTAPDRLLRPRDAGRFTACELLAPAVPERLQVDAGNWGQYSLDECTASTDGSMTATKARLFLDISDAEPREQNKIDGQCWTGFELPHARVPLDSALATNATLVTDTCAGTRRMIARVVAAARRTPPQVDPTGLLYDWSDDTTADLSSTGACADILDAAALECTPARPADVPADAADLLEQAEADPDVLCAAAAPLVRAWYGDTLAPATVLTATRAQQVEGAPLTECAFGEPTHSLHITVLASTQQQLLSEDEEISGHPATTSTSGDVEGVSPMRRFSIGWRTGKPGVLSVTVLATPTRAEGNWQGIEIDRTPVDEADGFVADLVEQLLD